MKRHALTVVVALVLSACGSRATSSLNDTPSQTGSSYYDALSPDQVRDLIYGGLATAQSKVMKESGKRCVLFLAGTKPGRHGISEMNEAGNAITSHAETHYAKSAEPYVLSADEKLSLSTKADVEIFFVVFDAAGNMVHDIGQFSLSKSFIDQYRERAGEKLAENLLEELRFRVNGPVPLPPPPIN